MINKLKEIVKKIQFHTDLTIEQIAKSINYSRVHLSKEIKKGQNETIEKLLFEKYPDILQNVTDNATKGKEIDKPEKDQIIKLFEENKKLLEDKVKKLEEEKKDWEKDKEKLEEENRILKANASKRKMATSESDKSFKAK